MLPSNIAHKPKITSGPSIFFKGADFGIIVEGVDVMAALQDLFDESIQNKEEQRLVEEQERAEEKERTAKEAGRRKGAPEEEAYEEESFIEELLNKETTARLERL